MGASTSPGTFGRRHLLIAACSAALPFSARGVGVYTPHELAQSFVSRVPQSLRPPEREVRLYGAIAELHLMTHRQALEAPQYMLVVDKCPQVQAAFLLWRLVAGHHQLVGAAPVSTGDEARGDAFETPQGVFEHQDQEGQAGSRRVYDFGMQRTRVTLASGKGKLVDMRLQMRAADRASERLLGTAHSDGCILLPATLVDFIDEFGLLDGAGQGEAPRRASRHVLPFRGRHIVVVDSERDERPSWSPSPLQATLAVK